MGFGVNLFGYQPEFINKALKEQIDSTMQLGLQVPISGQVTELICKLTGSERVTYCNSGTEAVMTALRLVRTKTKRNKVVQFNMSYHGHFDVTLGEQQEDNYQAQPMVSGVQPGAVEDVLILDYGSEEALRTIEQNANEIAAVIVEPVQSRQLHVQPKAFLQQLRSLTERLGVILIFDEIITGFRTHPGGVQALLNIKADLVTYGKIVGGGMPIGVVAGKAEIMDGIDGGFWAVSYTHLRAHETV